MRRRGSKGRRRLRLSNGKQLKSKELVECRAEGRESTGKEGWEWLKITLGRAYLGGGFFTKRVHTARALNVIGQRGANDFWGDHSFATTCMAAQS